MGKFSGNRKNSQKKGLFRNLQESSASEYQVLYAALLTVLLIIGGVEINPGPVSTCIAVSI